MTTRATAFLWLILGLMLAALTALSASALPESRTSDVGEEARECPVRISNYRQAIVLRGREPKRMLLSAESACGDGPGLPLRLEHVRLTIESDGKRFARVESPRGLYSSARNRLLIDHVVGPVEPGCLGLDASAITVDLSGKRLHSADGWLLKLDDSWAQLACMQTL